MIIYNMKLASYLMMKNFVLQGVEKDIHKPKYNVFHFKESDKLLKAIEDFKKDRDRFIF